jgi:AcrR family transcriptional regulator
MITTAPPLTARARARAELTAEIVDTARQHLASDGAAALSLRAIARELGMASSAIYRYFPSRDDLLTRLIVDAYDALGEAAEHSEARVKRSDLRGRFAATCSGVREWSLANPHEYALIYGSPVPGYAAPVDTIGPATRVATLLVAVMAQAHAEARVALRSESPLPRAAIRSMSPAVHAFPVDLPPDLVLRGLLAFSGIFGAISFELFGQLHNVIDEDPKLREAFFTAEMVRLADLVGLA